VLLLLLSSFVKVAIFLQLLQVGQVPFSKGSLLGLTKVDIFTSHILFVIQQME